ncbi:hypothetical protein [Kangiella sp. HZ709]|uniref:hypothetical protein n=1 Tax=Kangiella sp. HZ709 TaxID=2666328 RepID=UPI0012B12911|nr:hypothetical protein [Kangiella sp. HZ709]MRX28189.1 hypothetical protein [Kangiella sp. HZ709]
MAVIGKDSKARLEKFIDHQDKDEFDSEDLFLDLCRVLILMLAVFAIVYALGFS